jgi:MFS family permease
MPDSVQYVLLVVPAAAILIGFLAGRRKRRMEWPVFFILVMALFAVAVATAAFLLSWFDWKAYDDWIQSEIDRAVTVKELRGWERTDYELEYGGGFSSRIVRRAFEPPYSESLSLGIVAGIAGAALGLLVRRIAAMPYIRRARQGLCMGCGYDLKGNTTGVCPECGEPLGGVCGR